MTEPTIQPAPVRKSIRVNAPVAKAFDVFTAGMARWWPRGYSIGKAPMKEVILEPGVNGRWIERGEDGSECVLGRILAWEPPARFVLAWQISGEWKYDPALVTEVEVRFVADGTGTRVELEHRNLERFGAHAAAMRAAIDEPRGWTTFLELFKAAAEG
jgi:uncharacterized protein YndB with AHSA1/START domain